LKGRLVATRVGSHASLAGLVVGFEGGVRVGVAKSGCFADFLCFDKAVVAGGVADSWDCVIAFVEKGVSFLRSACGGGKIGK
jgi:hypothetical protein